MRKNSKNEKVIRAMAIGISAMLMASSPLTALAAEGEGLVGLVELGTVDQLGAVDVVFTVFHNFILLCGLSDQFPPT